MPLYRKLKAIVDSGELGPLRLIQVNFGSYKEYDMNNRFFNRSLTLHTKQPKRATIAFDKGYLEIFEYPRSMAATITYTENGHKEV